MDNREERIRRRAFELWQNAGSPDGSGEEWWLQAEREIAQTDPVIEQHSTEAAALREVQREHPDVVLDVGQRKRTGLGTKKRKAGSAVV
jgi:hypothetical protein